MEDKCVCDHCAYRDNIIAIMDKQREKGINKYGVTLEDNTTLTTEQRIEHAEEELIDALQYLEHLKVTLADKMTANDYQRAAMRTASGMNYDKVDGNGLLLNGVMGLNGEAVGVTLGEVMQRNVDKLKKRYPDGFDKNRSINRTEEQHD